MKRMTMTTILLFFTLMIPFASSSFGAVIIIPDNYPTIQGGIDAAATGDTVLVRDGLYLLTAAIDFKGKAITVQSEHGASSCFLDGQNTTRVVYFHSGETNTSVLSGFTIRNGRANPGAGIFCLSSSPTISHCNITSNTAYQSSNHSYGGGISCSSSSPIISDCVINGNRAETVSASGAYPYGAGIHIDGGSPTIIRCTINGNIGTTQAWGAFGGGIYGTGSTPNIIDSAIGNNSVSSTQNAKGGGIYFSTSTPSLVNCIVNGNSAQTGAGVYFDSSSTFSNMTNCTVVRNTASVNGGGLYCASSSPKVINSIFWEDSPQEIYNDASSSPTVTYSDVYGGYTGTGNIDASPAFVNIALPDFHLTSASAAKNTGSNSAPYLPLYDKDGKVRINGSSVDMGAYEYQYHPQAAGLTVFRPDSGIWYTLLSNGSYTSTQWGLSTDFPVFADYDGDGTMDIAVWRASTGIWYVLPSHSAGTFTATQWGIPTDKPIPSDYDLDGTTDIAVWRPGTGVWYILPSGSPGTYTATQWGTDGDVPISSFMGIRPQVP